MSATLEAKKREGFKQSDLTEMRTEGNIPAVIYGKGVNSEAVYVDSKQLLKTIRDVGRNGVIQLNLDGNKHNVILQDYQQDAIKNEITHADFFAVDLSSEITSTVRVELVGEAAGVKDGGVMQQPLFEVSITAKVSEMPDAISIDVSGLQVNETITVGDIRNNYSFAINHEDEETIVSILAPRQEEEISTGEEQEPGIPDNQEGRETEAEE
ncbi:MAG TPA: 50S ribosomal protein L25/general stress protein Ctc [Chondromyces sp.]|nr:50S ribosomal protein L25/general stress protein Ctc [Chondromyces sp.]